MALNDASVKRTHKQGIAQNLLPEGSSDAAVPRNPDAPAVHLDENPIIPDIYKCKIDLYLIT